jgi:integrase
MGGGINKLTELAIKTFVKAAVPGSKLADGGGLHLFITPAGSATWRIKYRITGKERLFSVGPYPTITLGAARNELAAAKALLRQYKDPVAERRLQRAEGFAASEQTFGVVAAEWLAKKKAEWSATHYTKSARALERDVLPYLGKLPIASISTAMVSVVIERIHSRDVQETAKRILTQINGIFRYAVAKGWCRANPATESAAILPRKNEPTRFPALIAFRDLGDVLRRAQAANLSRSVYMAHRLIAFTAMRITNIVDAEWNEFDLECEQPLWVIPREKMKKKDKRFPAHRVPLAPVIAAELREWRKIAPKSAFVFPSPGDASKSIGREALEKAYRVTLCLADIHCPHGWRSSLTSQANDHRFDEMVVKTSTDRTHDTEVAMAYDRSERFDQRTELFLWWAKQLVAAQAGAKIAPPKVVPALIDTMLPVIAQDATGA